MTEESHAGQEAASDLILRQFIDYLMPLLKPYETMIYLYLLGQTRLRGRSSTRVGQRTISKECGVVTRSSSGGNQRHVRDVLNHLEEKGCIVIGATTRKGTLYEVRLPEEVPDARARMQVEPTTPPDYFRDPALRRELYARDAWTCHYCGEPVTEENATLDHLCPQSKGGGDDPENLVTACLVCNSIKSGKTEAEAAPLLLDSMRKRRRPPGK